MSQQNNIENLSSSNNPLVSVVMPAFNTIKYIENAVNSIIEQSCTDWELIIVDDCSTDGTGEYLTSIKHPKIRVFKNEANLGYSGSVNYAISKSLGKYIAKMDSDDISLPQRLQMQIQYLESHPEIDCVGCGIVRVTEDLKTVIYKIIYPEIDRAIKQIVAFDRRFFFGPNIWLPDCCIMAKSQWLKENPYTRSIKHGQDFELFLRKANSSQYANVPEFLHIYRKAGITSISRNQLSSIWTKFKVILSNGFSTNSMRIYSIIGLLSLLLRPLIVLFLNSRIYNYRHVLFGEAETGAAFLEKLMKQQKGQF